MCLYTTSVGLYARLHTFIHNLSVFTHLIVFCMCLHMSPHDLHTSIHRSHTCIFETRVYKYVYTRFKRVLHV